MQIAKSVLITLIIRISVKNVKKTFNIIVKIIYALQNKFVIRIFKIAVSALEIYQINTLNANNVEKAIPKNIFAENFALMDSVNLKFFNNSINLYKYERF